MKFVQKEFSCQLEEKKSKFIAYIFPYKNFNLILDRLKKEHPKARHFVYAYRYLNDFKQIVENSSDDGEPKGTSGKPSLSVLNGADIINTGVIIVRYFGGIKLGTGGLVRAYGNSVNEVLRNSELFDYKELFQKNLICDYQDLSKVEYLLNKEEILINSKTFTNNVKLNISLDKNDFNNLKTLLPRNIEILE